MEPLPATRAPQVTNHPPEAIQVATAHDRKGADPAARWRGLEWPLRVDSTRSLEGGGMTGVATLSAVQAGQGWGSRRGPRGLCGAQRAIAPLLELAVDAHDRPVGEPRCGH